MSKPQDDIEDILILAERELAFLSETLSEFAEIKTTREGSALLSSLKTGQDSARQLRAAQAAQERAS